MLERSRKISAFSLIARKMVLTLAAISFTISTLPLPSLGEEIHGQLNNNKSRVGATVKKPAPQDIVIVRLTQGADRDKFNQTLQEVNGTYLRTIDAGAQLQFLVIQTEPGKAAEVEKKLKGKPDIASVERNSRYSLKDSLVPVSGSYTAQSGTGYAGGIAPTSLQPSDPFFSAQWDLFQMNYPQGRLLASANSPLVPIYFLDTGMAYFPGESALYAGQFDFSDPTDPTGAFEPMHDSGFHGTATSSVTASSDNGIGYAGMANYELNRCQVYMLRISQDGEHAYTTNILSALAFILRDPLCKAGPVNISFGAAPPNTLNADPDVQLIAYYLYFKGCLVVLAAGNDGLEDSSPEVFCRRVAATDVNGNLASFSDYGPFTAAAPGVNVPVYIPSAGPSGEYVASGTSFSAPRWCSAIVAIMAITKSSRNRNAPYADMVLRSTASTTSAGLQIPNLQAAMQYFTKSSSSSNSSSN